MDSVVFVVGLAAAYFCGFVCLYADPGYIQPRAPLLDTIREWGFTVEWGRPELGTRGPQFTGKMGPPGPILTLLHSA